MFGENALINRVPRNAHCVAMEFTDLGILDIESYNQIFKKLQEEEQRFKKGFFERTVFKEQHLWDQAKLIMSYFDKRVYPRGYNLFKRGTPCKKVWIVVEGQVVFWENVAIKKNIDYDHISQLVKSQPVKRVDCIIQADGDFIGEEVALDTIESSPKNHSNIQTRPKLYEYFATTNTQIICYECTKESFAHFFKINNDLREFFTKQIESKIMLISHMRDKLDQRKSKINLTQAVESIQIRKAVKEAESKNREFSINQTRIADRLDDVNESRQIPRKYLKALDNISNIRSLENLTREAPIKENTSENFFKLVTRTKLKDGDIDGGNRKLNSFFEIKKIKRKIQFRVDPELFVTHPKQDAERPDVGAYMRSNNAFRSSSSSSHILVDKMKYRLLEPKSEMQVDSLLKLKPIFVGSLRKVASDANSHSSPDQSRSPEKSAIKKGSTFQREASLGRIPAKMILEGSMVDLKTSAISGSKLNLKRLISKASEFSFPILSKSTSMAGSPVKYRRVHMGKSNGSITDL